MSITTYDRPAGVEMTDAYEDDPGELLADHADGRMDPVLARVFVAIVIMSSLALWGTVDLTLRALSWWWA